MDSISTEKFPRFRNPDDIKWGDILVYLFFSAVISSTSPIILKCSSPGIHFTIDAVTISRYNGTNIFMSSTADALRQCNRSQTLVEGRHECQFDVNYDKLGIDMLSVIAVVVKYHCLSE